MLPRGWVPARVLYRVPRILGREFMGWLGVLAIPLHTHNKGAWEAATEAKCTLGVLGDPKLVPSRRTTIQTHPGQAPPYSQRAIEQP